MTTNRLNARLLQPEDGVYRVLVIGDDLDYARQLMAALLKARLQCHHVAGGTAGLDAWRETHPHLIVLDLALVEPGAAELCARVREQSAVPILLAASEQDAEDAQMEALRLGADAILAKSLCARLLRGQVVAQLRRVYDYDWQGGASQNGAARNHPGLGTDTSVTDAERERAAEAVAAAVRQMGAEKIPAPSAKRSGGDGPTVCDACGYSGALESFRAQPGSDTLVCPQCGESGMVAFKLG